MRETLCAGRVKIFAEVLMLYTRAVFQYVIVRKMASSEIKLRGNKKVEFGRC
jgi:hypothetical protein